MTDETGQDHGTTWLTELPENPLHRRFRDRPWIRAMRWATGCAAAAAVACIILTLV